MHYRFINVTRTFGPGIFTERFNLSFDPKDYFSRFRLTCDPSTNNVTPIGEVFSNAGCNTLDPTGQSISHGEVEDYPPQGNFGRTTPEPSSILGLFAIGGLGLTKLRKKRQ